MSDLDRLDAWSIAHRVVLRHILALLDELLPREATGTGADITRSRLRDQLLAIIGPAATQDFDAAAAVLIPALQELDDVLGVSRTDETQPKHGQT